MKSTNSTFFKTIRAIVIIVALIFSSNTFATNGNSDRNDNGREHNNSHGYINGEGHPNRGRGHYTRGGENGNGFGYGHKPNGDGTTSVPLDGGLGILLLGAAAFGVKKLRDNKNDKL